MFGPCCRVASSLRSPTDADLLSTFIDSVYRFVPARDAEGGPAMRRYCRSALRPGRVLGGIAAPAWRGRAHHSSASSVRCGRCVKCISLPCCSTEVISTVWTCCAIVVTGSGRCLLVCGEGVRLGSRDVRCGLCFRGMPLSLEIHLQPRKPRALRGAPALPDEAGTLRSGWTAIDASEERLVEGRIAAGHISYQTMRGLGDLDECPFEIWVMRRPVSGVVTEGGSD